MRVPKPCVPYSIHKPIQRVTLIVYTVVQKAAMPPRGARKIVKYEHEVRVVVQWGGPNIKSKIKGKFYIAKVVAKP